MNGQGYTDVDGTPVTSRGPVFPMCFALLFGLLGTSVATAFLASRLFYVLNIMLAYYLGAKLFGRMAGFLSSLLILSSSSLSEWAAYIHIDHVFSAFILLNLIALLWSSEDKGYWRFVVSGCLLGVTYLLKESTVLLLPLPTLLLMSMSWFRTKRNAYGVGVLYLTFFVTVAPWWIRVHELTEEIGILGGAGGPGAVATLLEAITKEGAWWFLHAMANYYAMILAPNFGLASLFVVSWIVVFVLAYRGELSATYCGMVAVCFLPLFLFQGLEGWRPHQGMAFFVLSYLVLAGIVCRLAQFAGRWWDLKESVVQVMSFALVLFLLGLQLATEEWRWLAHVKRYNAIGFMNRSQDGIGIGRWSDAKDAAEWLCSNVEPGSAILSDFSYRNALHFFSRGDYFFYETPLVCSPYYSGRLFKGCSLPSDANVVGRRQKVLFLWPDGGRGFLSYTDQSALVAVAEENLLSSIERQEAKYIVLPQRNGFLSLYFKRSPNFLAVASFNGGSLKVYRVDGTEPVNFPLHIERRLPKYLNDMKLREPSKYNLLRDNYLVGALGFSLAEIKELEKETLPNFDIVRIYQTGVSGECLVGWTITVREKGLDYTGHLLVGDGYGDGVSKMVARIYDAPTGGTCLWWQDFDKVHMSKGNFLLKLATADPNLLRYRVKGAPLFLEVSIDECGPIDPRQELTDELDSQDPGLFVKFGSFYLKQRSLSDACAAFDKALAVGGIVKERRLDLARRYVTRAKKAEARNLNDEATDAYLQAISLYIGELQRTATDASVSLSVGQAYEAVGEVDAAVAAYERTIDMDPSMAETFLHLGNLFVQNGDQERAIELYREAARMNPEASWPHLELGKIHLDYQQ